MCATRQAGRQKERKQLTTVGEPPIQINPRPGPDYWNINKQWRSCSSGRKQSPVDIRTDRLVYDHLLGPIHLTWQRAAPLALGAAQAQAAAPDDGSSWPSGSLPLPEVAEVLDESADKSDNKNNHPAEAGATSGHQAPVRVHLLNSGRGIEAWLEGREGGPLGTSSLATRTDANNLEAVGRPELMDKLHNNNNNNNNNDHHQQQQQLIISRGPLSYSYKLFKIELHSSSNYATNKQLNEQTEEDNFNDDHVDNSSNQNENNTHERAGGGGSGGQLRARSRGVPEASKSTSSGGKSSEHLIDGKSFDAELQLHFYNRHLALSSHEALNLINLGPSASAPASLFTIISVFVSLRRKEAKDQATTMATATLTTTTNTTLDGPLDFILNNLQALQNQGNGIELRLARHHIDSLITTKSDYITYQGSLNRPPCAESVDWILLNKALRVDLEKFAPLYEKLNTNQENIRPIKPLNGRQLRTSINLGPSNNHLYQSKANDCEKQSNCTNRLPPLNSLASSRAQGKAEEIKLSNWRQCSMKPNYVYQFSYGKSLANENRIVKGAKRTLRAEVNLVIVIIIITSWSIYALYKLALSNSDSYSLFGKSNNQESATNNSSIVYVNSDQQQVWPQQRQALIDQQNQLQSPLTPQQQLALYKRQILRELLERQRELFGSRSRLIEPALNPEINGEKFDFNQLKQWQGGLKLPPTLDNLSTNQSPLLESQPAPTPPKSIESLQTNSKAHRNAPYLMQPRAPTMISRTFNLKPDANIVDYDREPEESSTDPRDYESQKEEASDSASDSANEDGTTTEAPLLDTTTMVPTTATTTTTTTSTTTEEPPLSEQISSSLETTTVLPLDVNQEDSGDNDNSSNNKSNIDDDDDKEPDEESMRRVKKTIHNIDDEVDRMTQPSSGMISQHRDGQHRRPNSKVSYKETVQFDDSPGNVSHQARVAAPKFERRVLRDRKQPHEPSPSDDLITDHHRPRKKIRPAERHNSTATSASGALPVLNNLLMNGRKRTRRSAPNDYNLSGRISSRQDDGGDDDDDDDNNDDDNHPVAQQKGDANNDKQTGASQTSPGRDYHYIESSDPSLQELLAHKQLLEALQQSRVPSPVSGLSSSVDHNLGNQSMNLMPSRSTVNANHQSADTEHYSIDKGLLLYPAEDEEHHYKKSAKKSAHASKKAEKKKEHVSMKKGGHKKKKHKKEEKKYHKEKKFKGAKKGKKMKKGKGGKGGKKGSKYYKDKGFKKKGFKNIYVKNEFGQKKSYFDEFRDKDFKKKWKNFDDKYKYAQMKKWQAKEMKGAKKVKDHGEHMKKYDKSKWKKKYLALKKSHESKKKKKLDEFR